MSENLRKIRFKLLFKQAAVFSYKVREYISIGTVKNIVKIIVCDFCNKLGDRNMGVFYPVMNIPSEVCYFLGFKVNDFIASHFIFHKRFFKFIFDEIRMAQRIIKYFCPVIFVD